MRLELVLLSGLQQLERRPQPLAPMPTRVALGILFLAAATAAILVAAIARQTPPRLRAPSRFPASLSPGDVPALWVFVRAGCRPCRRHVDALQRALETLAPAARETVAARLHLVGDLPLATPVHRHAAAWLHRLDITATPLTWWVGADSSIVRAWLGARDETSWQRALAFAAGGAP